MFTPDDSQLAALKTWYPANHKLHMDARHPCIKLAGEAGEILDLFGKHEYKPHFDWMDCKCKWHKNDHRQGKTPNGKKCDYVPLILDELGDYSYYLRILTYQQASTFEGLCQQCRPEFWQDTNEYSLLNLLALLSEKSTKVLTWYIIDGNITGLNYVTSLFLAILNRLDIPLSAILQLNYKKLNSEPTNHGWKDAISSTP